MRMAWVGLVAAVVAASAQAPNLLANGGFESDVDGREPAGWHASLPAGAELAVDPAAVSGKSALRLSIPGTAPVDWYTAYHVVEPLKRGATYTFSAQLRTADVRDGYGAYVSLAAFSGDGRRLAFFDGSTKLKGTTAWQRLSTTGQLPDGTTELRAIVVLHGRGTVWCDEAQVEEGPTATPFHLSAADAAQQAAREAQQRDADTWLAALPARKPGQARVAVLDLGPVPASSERAPSDPAVLAAALRDRFAVTTLTPEQLANPVFLDPKQFDVVILPAGDLFPLPARAAFIRYLRRGGAFLSTGGYAFDQPVVQSGGRWSPPTALPAPTTPEAPVAIAPTAWQPSTNRPEKPGIVPASGPHGEPGIELSTPSLTGWDSAVSPDLSGKLPADWSVTRLWVKGDGSMKSVWVEWSETDGSRWHVAVPLTTEWREQVLYPGDFSYWQDNPSVGRGGSGDHFRPAQARQLQLGIAVDIAERDVPHRVSLAGVRVQADPQAAQRVPPPTINTRWGRIRDAMWPEPEQLGVFDPAFRLLDVASTRPAPGQETITAARLDGPLQGWSAVAMLSNQGHGFGPNRARWEPLLECVDAWGRPRGHAGAIVRHYTGTFAGSNWAIFGVTNRDLFAAGSPALKQVLVPTVDALLRRCYLHDTEAAYACYRPGETVTLRTIVSNHGPAPQAVQVRFQVTPRGGAPVTKPAPAATIPPGSSSTVEAPWPLPATPVDSYEVTAELAVDGRTLDHERNRFLVWTPGILAKGPALSRAGNRFTLEGTPQFLMGCQTYWGQNGSVTARSPAAFDRDFRAMRDHGLRWTRCFLPFKTEEDKRISDAIVQLAQQYGIVLYHTPNLTNTADPAALAAEVATAREIAERYRDVPGVVVDICNEPAFNAKDPALTKLFGREGKTEGPGDDVAAYHRTVAEAQRRWATANAEAVHAGDRDMLASVGWSQGWAGGASLKDPLLASLDLDFTDRHYYGPPEGLPAELKDVDLRGLGKPLILGECGAKNHPSFRARDPWHMGDNDAEYDRRFLFLGHRALGLGAATVSSWHWRDPMEGIFPCGLVLSSGVPRPTAAAWRAMALTFGQLRPVSTQPPVVLLTPDAPRLSGRRDLAIRALHRASDLLVASRVDFTLLPDDSVDRLPAGTKAVVYPCPGDAPAAVVKRLAEFAAAGGSVYVSGASPAGLAGQTRVRCVPEPIEQVPVMAPQHRAAYREFLAAAGVPRVEATPDTPELQVYRVPGADADGYILVNQGLALTATVAGWSLDLSADGTGFLLLGHDGGLRAAEGQGALRQGDREVVRWSGHGFVLAEVGADLEHARSLLLLPLTPGPVRVKRTGLSRAEYGDWQDRQWRQLGAAAVAHEGGALVVTVSPEHARDAVRVQ